MRRHLRETGAMPTVSEIQKEFHYRSPATVTTHLQGLENKGAIERRHGKHRNLRFTTSWQPRETRDVPFLGSIPAGYPDDAELQTDSSVAFDVETLGLRPNGSFFVLEVSGDSMVGAAILDGDTVLLEHDVEPQNGNIVAALIDGQTALKRFLIKHGKPCLVSENPKYVDLIPARELLVQGVFRALIRAAKR